MQQLSLERFDRKWSEVFVDYRILTDWDKVRKNTHDDYGLGPRYHFVTGSHVDRVRNGRPTAVWHVVYAQLLPELEAQMRPRMCDGTIGGVQPHDWGERGVQLIATDGHMITSLHVCRLLDCPADLAIFNSLARIAAVPHPVTDGSGV